MLTWDLVTKILHVFVGLILLPASDVNSDCCKVLRTNGAAWTACCDIWVEKASHFAVRGWRAIKRKSQSQGEDEHEEFSATVAETVNEKG